MRNNLEPAFLPVEHYRPKLEANRGPGFPSHGYWWLAWTWRNLLFSCQPCNTSHKGIKFPLGPASAALVPEQSPPGTELPLLIDPASEDAISHVKFTHHPNLTRQRWRPLPRNGSAKGHQTIRVLGLDRPMLLDLYDKHVDDHIKPIVNRLNTAILAATGPRIRRIWHDAVEGWLNPGRPFVALFVRRVRSLRTAFRTTKMESGSTEAPLILRQIDGSAEAHRRLRS